MPTAERPGTSGDPDLFIIYGCRYVRFYYDQVQIFLIS
jgi:hypothetical protein